MSDCGDLVGSKMANDLMIHLVPSNWACPISNTKFQVHSQMRGQLVLRCFCILENRYEAITPKKKKNPR